jgi:hypothetical protein
LVASAMRSLWVKGSKSNLVLVKSNSSINKDFSADSKLYVQRGSNGVT